MAASEETFNCRIKILLEDPEFAAGALQRLTSLFGRLGGSGFDELLEVDGVPVWTLIRNALFQILEPELYSLCLVDAALELEPAGRILLSDEDPILTRAVRLHAASRGIPVLLASPRSSATRPREEHRPLFRPTGSRGRAPAVRSARRPLILVYAERMGNVAILRPLLERLATREDVAVHFLRRSKHHDVAGIPLGKIWQLNDVLSMSGGAPAARQRPRTPAMNWRGLVRDGPLNFEPLVRRKLRRTFSPDVLAGVAGRARAIRAFLEALRPDLVVNADGIMPTPVTMDWAAGTLGIPRLKILHYDEQLFRMWTLTSVENWDHVALLGSAPREPLRALEIAENKLVETGYPFFDRRLAAIRSLPARPPEPRRILFTAQGLPEEPGVFRRLFEAFSRLPEYRLIVRPHPLRHDSLAGLREAPPNVCRSRRANLYEEIQSRALVATISSVTAVEAALLERPVLILEPRPGHPNIPSLFYTPYGVGRHLFDLDRIDEAVRGLCEDASWEARVRAGKRRIVEDFFPGAGENATETATARLERTILTLVNRAR